MTNENDLIRRGDVARAVAGLAQEFADGGAPTAVAVLNLAVDRIAAIPAVAASQTADPVIKADSCQRVTVKPLVWERHPMGWIAGAMFGPAYIIDVRIKGRVMFIKGMNPSPQLDDIEAAKAAAQADYEQRVLAAIETTPDPRDAVIAGQAEALTAANGYITDLIRHEGQEGFSNSTYDLGVAYDKALAAIAAAKGGAA